MKRPYAKRTDEEKAEMKRLYLEGHSIDEIAEKFGIQRRTIYFYLSPIPKEEQFTHFQKRLERKNGND